MYVSCPVSFRFWGNLLYNAMPIFTPLFLLNLFYMLKGVGLFYGVCHVHASLDYIPVYHGMMIPG